MIIQQIRRTIKKAAKFLGGKSEDVGDTFNSDFKVFGMRDNQREVFNVFRDSIRFLLTQPPGSGKSAIINFVMAHRLLHWPNHKIIIVVPQTLIAKSFGKAILKYDDGTIIHWDILHDLCNGNYTRKQKVIVKFLKKKNFTNNNNERVLITTHQALATVFNKMKLTTEDFNDTSVVIDEAHHILYSDFLSNQMGQMVRIINGNQTSSLWLVTATPFRGDKNNIIPKEEFDKFDKFYLPLDKHWRENIKNIESFTFSFVIYKKDKIFEDFETIMKNKKKTIIFCPFYGRLIKGKNKHDFKKEIIEKILKVWPECRIVDLINTYGRDQKKLDLLDDKQANDIDVILTLKIFDEGTDWIYAEQCIDFSPPESLRVLYQRFGRLWRDLFEKINIEYYCFLPFESNFKNEEERRDHLNKSYCAFVASLLLQEIVDPIPYPVKEEKNEEKKNQYRLNPFEFATRDESHQQLILEDIVKNLEIMASYNENPTKKEVYDCISTILTNHNIIEDQNDVIVHIAKILRRQHELLKPSWKDQTVDVSWMVNAGFEEIFINEIFKDLLIFATKTCGIDHFKKFREVYESKLKTCDEWVKIAEELAKKHNGLPTPKWLKNNGYSGLIAMLTKYPEKFAHIKRQKRMISPDEWVKIAEELAKKHNGLPNHDWLKNNGYSGLSGMLTKYPEKFAHIKKQKEVRKSIDEWIKFSEELAKKHNGLPNSTWLKDNGYSGLIAMLTKYPEKFAHIKRQKKRILCSEWVKIAEELAKKHNGLPTVKWLKNNGYSGLAGMLTRYPEKFDHIKRQYITKSIDEWIKISEELAKKHNGLPNHNWLKNNGYSGLVRAIQKYPEIFAHIKRKNPKPRKSYATQPSL